MDLRARPQVICLQCARGHAGLAEESVIPHSARNGRESRQQRDRYGELPEAIMEVARRALS